MTQSNLALSANVMLVADSWRDELRHLPGDFAHLVYGRDLLSRPALVEQYLTPEQQIEYLQYLPCALCSKPCAGTCSRRWTGMPSTNHSPTDLQGPTDGGNNSRLSSPK
jgi:hypothetical protein